MVSLYVDAGSSAVKFCVLKSWPAGREILACDSIPTTKFAWEKDTHTVIANAKKHFSGISEIIFNLSPSVFRAGVFEYSFTRKNPSAAITLKEEQSLGKEMLGLARKEMTEYFSKIYGIPPEELMVMKIKMVHAEISGYSVSHLRGYAGPSLRLRVLGTCLPIEYKNFFDRLKRLYKIKQLKLSHWAEGIEAFAIGQKHDGIFIDAGDQMTQLAVMRQHTILGVQDVKYGGDNFSYALEMKLGFQETMARDFKERYSRNEFTEEMRKKMHDVFQPEAQKWVALCKEKLLSMNNVLPSKIFLMGGGSQLPEIATELTASFEDLPINGNLEITFLDPQNVIKNIKHSKGGNVIYTPLFLLTYGK